MEEINEHLSKQLQQRYSANALRKLPETSGGIDFCSNDYLGFAREKFSSEDFLYAGATGSRLISGNHPAYRQLESALSRYFEVEAALVFGSGYQANLGLISSIGGRGDTIFYDQLVHASIRDALRLSLARNFPFRHNDVNHLQEKLSRAAGRKWVVVESVYSMDGDEAPLSEMLACCEREGAALIVDEAHAVGVFGPGGKGLGEEQGFAKALWARVITFGKALGSHGAAVLGSKLLKDFLINFSRPFIYTTGLPPQTLCRIQKAFELLARTDRIKILYQRIDQFREALRPEVKASLIPSRSAIQSLLVPGNDEVKRLARELQDAGLNILPILHPTVPKGQERLRICLHSFNTPQEIHQLTQTLNDRW